MSETRKKPLSATAKRVAAYRQRQRSAGLKPRTIWVPDTKDPAFIAEYQRQALALAADPTGEDEIMEWLAAVSDWPRGDDDIPAYTLPDKK